MKYLKVQWRHSNPHDPVLIFCELNEQRWESRKVEVFRDGRYCYAGPTGTTGPTRLAEIQIPELKEINSSPEFSGKEIAKEEFEKAWSESLRSIKK